MNKTRVLLADDHALLRIGLKTTINAQEDMEVVAEAEQSDDALQQAKTCHPDVALLDLAMPGGGGIQVCLEIRKHLPGTKVLILTMYDDMAHLRAALSSGADGYVVKSADSSEIISAIRALRRNRSYIDASLTHESLDRLADVRTERELKKRSPSQLSEREEQVLLAVVKGFTNRDIAEKLGVSIKTIETHRLRLSQKLGLKNRAELVEYALARDLLKKDDLP